MFIKNIKTQALALFAMLCLGTSCVNDLDNVKLDPNKESSEVVFDDPAAYKQFLAKIYAGLAVTGQKGPDGDPDVGGIDEGFSSYIRGYWKLQELTTDEAVVGWGDAGIQDLHNQNWSSSNPFINGIYQKIFNQITFCNEFLRQTEDSKLSDRGVEESLKAEIQTYRAEVRFMRALSYYHALDLFGNVPFVTEEHPIGKYLPEQISRTDLFNFLDEELKAIEPALMADAGGTYYGRADKKALWTLQAKLYLNAEVYTGTAKYGEAGAAARKVIDASIPLNGTYADIFKADNDNATGIIFPVRFDGVQTQTWGGTTFLVHAAVGGTMNAADFAIDGGWGGIRTTSGLVNKFKANDARGMFHTDGQSLEIKNISEFKDGYAITKFTNKKSDGTDGSHKTFVDTDFPLFRLADVYLMYAEAVARGANEDRAMAIGLVNDLRERAFGNTDENISSSDLTLDFIIDERARELYWEGHRRTDLVRFGKLSDGNYVWPWKGGVAEGTSTSSHLNLFPIPSSDLGANPNLSQNTGY